MIGVSISEFLFLKISRFDFYRARKDVTFGNSPWCFWTAGSGRPLKMTWRRYTKIYTSMYTEIFMNVYMTYVHTTFSFHILCDKRFFPPLRFHPWCMTHDLHDIFARTRIWSFGRLGRELLGRAEFCQTISVVYKSAPVNHPFHQDLYVYVTSFLHASFQLPSSKFFRS